MTRRLTLARLRAFDLAHDDCLVRRIEMAVDSVLTDTTYSIQFWRDVNLYGLNEAIMMLSHSGAISRRPDALTEVYALLHEAERLIGGVR